MIDYFPIIVDTNIFDIIFNPDHSEHAKYIPVLHCLRECKGVMFFGGSIFEKELKAKSERKSLALVTQLRIQNKLKILPKQVIDKLVGEIIEIESSKDFDDPHIIACAIESRCRVICTDDKRADKFIKKKELYPEKFKRPSIYRNLSHAHLLNDCCSDSDRFPLKAKKK